MNKSLSTLSFYALVSVISVGCQGRRDDDASAGATTTRAQDGGEVDGSKDPSQGTMDKRRVVAAKAKDALFAQLSGRLMEVMQSEGPAAAINVCGNEAASIAEAVGREHGVSIGRTSFKLRNPVNAPRDWVKPFIEQRSETPQHVQLEDGSLGALYPIRISVKCLMCHGGAEDVLDVVKPEIAKRYPEDAATGFQLDDLRGWFWVEVPAT